MNIAKPTEEDMDAALLLIGILSDVDQGQYPRDIDGEFSADLFDEDDGEHLLEFYKRVMHCLRTGGIGRVIWGMHTVMHNNVLDPDNDALALHPKFAKVEAALLKAKETIKLWHGDIAWDIYDKNSPEMKQINEAIEALKGQDR